VWDWKSNSHTDDSQLMAFVDEKEQREKEGKRTHKLVPVDVQDRNDEEIEISKEMSDLLLVRVCEKEMGVVERSRGGDPFTSVLTSYDDIVSLGLCPLLLVLLFVLPSLFPLLALLPSLVLLPQRLFMRSGGDTDPDRRDETALGGRADVLEGDEVGVGVFEKGEEAADIVHASKSVMEGVLGGRQGVGCV
jgi:hypothetical protein